MYRSCSFGKQCEFVELRDMQHGYFTEGDRCACGNFTTILSWILYRGVQVRMRKLYHNVDLDILQRVTGAHAQTLPQYWHGYFTEGNMCACKIFVKFFILLERATKKRVQTLPQYTNGYFAGRQVRMRKLVHICRYVLF